MTAPRILRQSAATGETMQVNMQRPIYVQGNYCSIKITFVYLTLDKRKVTEDNGEYQFRTMETFQNYSIYYLIVPQNYEFSSSSTLMVSKYTLKLCDISKYDQECLNKIVANVHPKIPFIPEQAYINSKHCVFFNSKGEGIYPTTLAGKRWMIRVQISGYKIDDKGNHSLVWKILIAKDARRINCIDDGDEYIL